MASNAPWNPSLTPSSDTTGLVGHPYIYDPNIYHSPSGSTDPGAADTANALQRQSLSGLASLLGQDTSAQDKSIEQALYQSQAEPINQAADRARGTLLEGTFGRGVGSSTIAPELLARTIEEPRNLALAEAARQAHTGAAAERRANTASSLSALTGAENAAQGQQQGEANIGLAANQQLSTADQFRQNMELAQRQLEQQGSQFGQSLGESESQFGRNLGQAQTQLGLQAGEFGQSLGQQGGQFQTGLDWQAQQNALNRLLQSGLLSQQLNNTNQLQSNNLLFQGLGSGVSGLAQLFGPYIARLLGG